MTICLAEALLLSSKGFLCGAALNVICVSETFVTLTFGRQMKSHPDRHYIIYLGLFYQLLLFHTHVRWSMIET